MTPVGGSGESAGSCSSGAKIPSSIPNPFPIPFPTGVKSPNTEECASSVLIPVG
jgi:hypothetical protein